MSGRGHRFRWLVAMTLIVAACSKEKPTSHQPDLASLKTNLAFTCVHEADRLPPLDPQADAFFKYARYLQKKDGPKNNDDIARYYRIAAAYGHHKANDNLQQMISKGLASSPNRPRESVDLAKQLVEQGIPVGYYDIGYYLNLGYGLKQDKDMALRYSRKAADLGNPEAQFYVAEKLSWIGAGDIPYLMYRCAAEQGHGEAADTLGVHLQNKLLYAEATQAFQQGVKVGDALSASYLEDAFKAPRSGNMNYLALPNDPERSRRYQLIIKFLDHNERNSPKVPDIDQIVPLPPAPLPEWDGTFQWEKEQAHVPPQPSQELIERLAKAKNLDPATGLPMPPPPKAPLGTGTAIGKPCPQSGQWCARYSDGSLAKRYTFQKGQTLPTYALAAPVASAAFP